MASSIKGITIEIGGNTTKLQDALKDVDKKSKDLQGELKQVDKLLKLDPHNTVLLAQKQELLAQSVANTSEKLKTLKQAQSQANEQFERGDINAEQYRALTREVEQTTQALESQEEALRQVNAQTAPLVPQIQALSDGATKFGKSTTELGKKLAPMSAAAGAAVAGMAGMAVAAGKFADDINTMSKVTGIATDDLQKFQYASDIIDVSIETLAGSMKKLTANMGKAKEGSKEASDTFKSLGVNIYGAGGKLRDNEDVMNDTITALGKISNETERDALSMKIFGKSAQDLNPLILGGADALKQLGLEAEQAGLIMSQDALDAANEFGDGIDRIKATSIGVFAQIGAEFGLAFLPVLDGIVEALKGLLEIMRSLDPAVIRIIGTVLLLVAGVAPLLMIIGQVSTGIGVLLKMLPYLIGGIAEVGGALKTIFAVMMANPILLVVAGIAALIIALGCLYETNEEVRAAIDGLWESIKAAFTRFMDFLKDIFSKDWSEQFGALGEIMNGAIKKWADLFENAKKIFSSVIEFIKAVFTGDWKAAWTAVKDIFAGVFELIGDIAKAPLNAIIGYLNAAISGINTLIEGINQIKFDVPEWVPGIGGKQFGFSVPQIPKIPLLAKGGQLLNGQAIIAEAGPELIQMQGSRAIVTPLTSNAYNSTVTGGTTVTIYANVPDYGALQSIITRFQGERQSTRRGVVK